MIESKLAQRTRRTVPAPLAVGPLKDGVRRDAGLTPLATFGLALWFGLAAGTAELLCELLRLAAFGPRAWLAPYQLNPHYLWMIPAAGVLILGALGVSLALLTRLSPRRSLIPVIWALLCVTAFMVLATARSIHLVASGIVAVGFASLVAPWLAGRRHALVRLARPTGAILALVVAGLAAFSFAREFQSERHV